MIRPDPPAPCLDPKIYPTHQEVVMRWHGRTELPTDSHVGHVRHHEEDECVTSS